MKRLLIIGSREFIIGAMDFTTMFAPGLSVLGMVDAGTDVVEDVRQTRPDVIVVDGVTNLSRAVACLPELRQEAPAARVIVVVEQPEHEDLTRALDAGAMVCAQPPGMRAESRDSRPDRWKAQLRSVPAPVLSDDGPGPVLTRREQEIMEWVAAGHTNARIARNLWVTEQTIKFHLTNIYRKLSVANRTEASHYVIQHGLVTPPDAPEPDAAEVPRTILEPVADASVVI